MVQQVTNVQETIKNLLKDNWTLKDTLAKEKITWASWMLKDHERFSNKSISIEVTKVSGVNTPQSPHITKMDPLYKINLIIKLKDPVGDKERLVLENNRETIIDQIYQIIHDNQVAISGLRIATFGNEMRSDEIEKEGHNSLNSTVFIRGQLYHTKS